MRHNFTIKSVNSPFEDSAFFVRNVYKRQAFLLDCGRLGNIKNTEVLSVSDIFISHTHIDHFYGFDRILRSFLRSEKKVRLFGPLGIIKNIEGKLASYTWNLVENYTFSLEVVELNNTGSYRTALYAAKNRFKPFYGVYTADVINLGDGFTLEFEFFDHGIPTVGYRIKEFIHVNIKKDELDKYGYLPDPWLNELKSRLRAGENIENPINVKTVKGIIKTTLGELEKRLVIYKPPQDISYITDFAPTYENYSKAVKFAYNSYILLIEGMFLKEDILHAIDKKHSSLELSKGIFLNSHSKHVRFFHFAPKYAKNKEEFFKRLYNGIADRVI